MSATVPTSCAARRSGAAAAGSKMSALASFGLIAGLSIGLWVVIARIVTGVAALF